MKNKFFAGIVCMAAFWSVAADTDLTLPENWKLANVKKGCTANLRKEADSSLLLTTDSPQCYLTCRFDYRKGKLLRIEGKIDSNDTYFIKLYFIDSKGKLIYMDQFNVAEGTHTELTEGADAKDTVLKVRDASKWKKGNSIAVGKGNELPNQHTYMARKGILSIAQKNGCWEVTLKQPWGKQSPGGTPLRQMVFGDGKLLLNQYRLPVKPQMLSYTLQDEFTDKNEANKWWRGAASVSMQIIMAGKSGEKKLRLTDFRIREIESNW